MGESRDGHRPGIPWAEAPGVVAFPDGRIIRGTGLCRPRLDAPPPDYAVYCVGREPAPAAWDAAWIPWRDFGLPRDTSHALDVLREAHRRAATQRVEVACGGGVGRTGTAMAILAVLSGVPSAEAVSWVRANYRRRAVETRGQRRWIETLGSTPAP